MHRFIALCLVAVMALVACAAPTPTLPPAGPTATVPSLLTLTPSAPPFPTPTVVPDGWVAVAFEGVTFLAEVVDTAETRAQGLSDRPSMPLDQGMLFDFGGEATPDFVMRRMHFPLDMVWVDGALRVVHVTHNAPTPEPGAELTGYDSGGIPVRYVLEINAGLAEQHGIGQGDEVRIAPPLSGG